MLDKHEEWKSSLYQTVENTGKADWKDQSQIKDAVFLGEVIAFYQEKKTVQIKGQICQLLLELSKFFKSTADHLCLNFRELLTKWFWNLLVKRPLLWSLDLSWIMTTNDCKVSVHLQRRIDCKVTFSSLFASEKWLKWQAYKNLLNHSLEVETMRSSHSWNTSGKCWVHLSSFPDVVIHYEEKGIAPYGLNFSFCMSRGMWPVNTCSLPQRTLLWAGFFKHEAKFAFYPCPTPLVIHFQREKFWLSSHMHKWVIR